MTNILLLFISVLVVLFVTEVALRFTFLKERYLGFDFPKGYHVQAKNYDNVTTHDIAKNYPITTFKFADGQHEIWSNGLGCFDSPYQGEKDYVLLVGDSFTWGFTPYEYKWGTVLEKEVGKRVLKCGACGAAAGWEYYKIVRTIDAIKNTPQLIVIGYCIGNDLWEDYLFPNPAPKPKGTIWSLKELLTEHSIIYNMVKKIEILRIIGKKIGIVARPTVTLTPVNGIAPLYSQSPVNISWLQDAWKKHLNYLDEIGKLADKNGSKMLIVLIPNREQVYEFLRPEVGNIDWDFTNKKIQYFFKGKGVYILDLTPAFREFADQTPRKSLNREKDLYWKYDGHWNIRGNHLAGLMIAKYILENNLISTADRENKLYNIEKELVKLKR